MASNGWYKDLFSVFTKHPSETENPQTYWQHGKFAAYNSLIIIWAGLAGIVHAIFPPAFPFYTSTILIRSFGKLVKSQRHVDELKREFGEENVIVDKDHTIIAKYTIIIRK